MLQQLKYFSISGSNPNNPLHLAPILHGVGIWLGWALIGALGEP